MHVGPQITRKQNTGPSAFAETFSDLVEILLEHFSVAAGPGGKVD